jgi:hypothetical protein
MLEVQADQAEVVVQVHLVAWVAAVAHRVDSAVVKVKVKVKVKAITPHLRS